MPRQIYTISDTELGLIAFPAAPSSSVKEMAGAVDEPLTVTLFETLEEYQDAKRKIVVENVLKKLTPQEIDALKIAFAKGELDGIGSPAPPAPVTDQVVAKPA